MGPGPSLAQALDLRFSARSECYIKKLYRSGVDNGT
jgi:hypothetical protein